MNIDEIRARGESLFSGGWEEPKDEEEMTTSQLVARKAQIEKELVRIRHRRYDGMDDDRAEDIVEDLYRELLDIERKIKSNK